MGNKINKLKAEKRYKLYKEKELENELENNKEDDNNITVYKRFCSRYQFCHDGFTVKEGELFAYKVYANFTIPSYEEEEEKTKLDYKGVSLINERSFYPYSAGTCGGNDVIVYVFKALEPGDGYISNCERKINIKIVKK